MNADGKVIKQETDKESKSLSPELIQSESHINVDSAKKFIWTKDKIFMTIIFGIVFLISIALLVVIMLDDTILFRLTRDYFILPLLKIGGWIFLAFIGIMILESVIAPIPSELVLLSAGMLFDMWLGVFIGVVGSVLSGVFTYFIALKGGRTIVDATSEKINFIDKFVFVVDKWIEKWGIWAIIVGRAVPVIMFDPISYGAGLANVKWKPYTIATFIGSIPRAIFYCFLGVQLLDGRPAEAIEHLSQTEFEAAANQFNTIFFVIFGVLVLMLIISSILTSRIKDEEMQRKI